jgi:hypothetical protein
MTYTLQLDRNGNTIVCRGADVRNGYRIVAEGTYAECNAARAGAVAQQARHNLDAIESALVSARAGMAERRAAAGAHYDGRWGTLNRRDAVAPGIDWIDGASHGGFILTADRVAAMPAELRAESFNYDNYFEEDCSAAAVLVAFPQYFDADRVARAAKHLDNVRAYRAAVAGEVARIDAATRTA